LHSVDTKHLHLQFVAIQVSAEDRAQVPHHLIDIVSPTCTTFSAHSFAERATTAIQDIASRGRTPIIVGGTGFFLRWLFYNLPSDSATVPLTSSHGADPALRAKLEHEVEHFLKQCQCSRNEAWSKLYVS
jgi:tRNA A37 N6-isopentenylltransferase MiaA